MNGLINTQMHNSPGISIVLIFITIGIGFKLSLALSQDFQDHVGEMGAASNHEALGECSTKPVLIGVVKK
ncbi:hypothetical protein Goshw_006343, partial [Gossypium schwendimanii]|nr:hypothetical protein [Gossypium schwendimanii]